MTIVVYPAMRHVRLTRAHIALLFGDRALQHLHTLSDGSAASDGLVDVVGPGGVVAGLRVLLPAVAKDAVYLDGADVVAGGFSFSVPHSPGSPGCTIRGPVGSVVCGQGVWPAEHARLPAADRLKLDVRVEGERPRVVRNVAVEVVVDGAAAAVYVNDIGDLRPGTKATVFS